MARTVPVEEMSPEDIEPLVARLPLVSDAVPSLSVPTVARVALRRAKLVSDEFANTAVPSVNVNIRIVPVLEMSPLLMEPVVARIPYVNVVVPSVKVAPRTVDALVMLPAVSMVEREHTSM